MSSLVTLASLRQQSQQRADQENSSFLSPAEWNLAVNASAKELYDLLTTVFEDYFESTYQLTTNGSNSYPLPADFYKLLGVDEILSPSQNVACKPYQYAERNAYTPFSDSNRKLNLLYVPAFQPLVADGDTFDGVNGWEEYIIVDVARKAATKEESFDLVATLKDDKKNLRERIEACAPNRDAGMGDRVTDIYRIDPFNDLFLTSRIRYRLRGSNISLVTYQTALGFP